MTNKNETFAGIFNNARAVGNNARANTAATGFAVATGESENAFSEAGDLARSLAADTLAGRRPFLGVFGVRDELAPQYGERVALCAGYVYLYAIHEIYPRGVPCDDAGYLVAQA